MRIPAKSDDALRAAIVMARAWPGARVTGEEISAATALPHSFLEAILGDLGRGGVIHGRRGYRGGYVLTRSPANINVADILLAVDCPLLTRPGGWDASPLAPLWALVETSTRELLAALFARRPRVGRGRAVAAHSSRSSVTARPNSSGISTIG